MERKSLASIPLSAKEEYSDNRYSPFVFRNRDSVQAAVGDVETGKSIRMVSKVGVKEKISKVKPQYIYEKISGAHGRSMTEVASSKNVIWGGPLKGDIYGARSLKGTAMYQGIRMDPGGISDYGVQGNGLMDDACIERAIRASEVLRENGLPTEKPVLVQVLNEVLKRGGVDTWQKLPTDIWEESILGPLAHYGVSRISKYLSETIFMTLHRDVQVDERLRDVNYGARGISELRAFLRPVFKWLKVATRYTDNGLIWGTPKPPAFNLSRESMDSYFNGFLPAQMGTYLGRLHSMGIVHGYPHSQNWSMVGTLYDLDSVFGKKIFSEDKKPKGENFVKDLSETVGSLSMTVERVERIINGPYSDGWKRIDPNAVLISNYIKERYGELNTITKLKLKASIKIFGNGGENFVMRILNDFL